jgi:hypothetical protein
MVCRAEIDAQGVCRVILFTISEVARALGCTYQAVDQRIGKIKPSGRKSEGVGLAAVDGLSARQAWCV